MTFYSRITHYDDLIASKEGILLLSFLAAGLLSFAYFSKSTFTFFLGTVFLGLVPVYLICIVRLNAILRLVRQGTGEKPKLLDFGTGSGILAAAAAKAIPDAQILAIDRLGESIERAQKRQQTMEGGDRVEFRKLDIHEMVFQDKSFDAVMALDVMTVHRQKVLWVATLNALGGKLKTNGFLITDVCYRGFNRAATGVALVLLLLLTGLHIPPFGFNGSAASFLLNVLLWVVPVFLLALNLVNGDTLVPVGLGRAAWNKKEIVAMFEAAGFASVEIRPMIPFLPTLLMVTARGFQKLT